MADSYTPKVQRWLQGHREAVQFIEDLFTVFHVVDDLTDRDHPVSTDHFQQTMLTALVTLPRNPFYQTYFALLNGAVHVAITNWQAANALEASGSLADLRIAFVLRSSYTDLVPLCAGLIGGESWRQQVAVEVRQDAASEGFEHYCTSLQQESRSPFIV